MIPTQRRRVRRSFPNPQPPQEPVQMSNPEAVTLDLDVTAESPTFDDDVRALIAKHGATLVYFQRSGPGGGNPNYGVVAPDRPTAAALVRELYADPSYDWQVNVRDPGAFDFHRYTPVPNSNVIGGGEAIYPAYGPGSLMDPSSYPEAIAEVENEREPA